MLSLEETHHEYFERVYTPQTSGGLHLEALSRLAKQYVILLELSRQASKVPLKDEKAPGLPVAYRVGDSQAFMEDSQFLEQT